MLEGPPPPGSPIADLESRFGEWIRIKVRRFFPRDADDVVQEVMLKLVQSLPRLRDVRVEATRAFVSRTVRSVCIDEWRRRAQRAPAADAAGLPLPDTKAAGPPEAAIGSEARAAVRVAWGGLPERERTILKLRFEDGLGFREIAELLGVPQGSVAGWYSRALAALREKLK